MPLFQGMIKTSDLLYVNFNAYSRTTLPLELRRQWSFWPDYTIVNPASTSICVDGEIGTVLKTYREVLRVQNLVHTLHS